MASSNQEDTIGTTSTTDMAILKLTTMTESRASASSTKKAMSPTTMPAAAFPLTQRIAEAIGTLNKQDMLLDTNVDHAITAVELAENAVAAAKHELAQAQSSVDINKPLIEHKRAMSGLLEVAKLFGRTTEDLESSRVMQELLEPYVLLAPKETLASTENQRAPKRRRTEVSDNTRAVQAFSRPYVRIESKRASASIHTTENELASITTTENERPPKRRHTTLTISADTPHNLVNWATSSRIRVTAKRKIAPFASTNAHMVSAGKKDSLVVKPMEIYHKYATTYIPTNMEKTTWIELRCSICGGNSSPSWKIPLKGARGFQMHMIQEHGRKGLKQHDIPELCKYRDIDQAELDDLAKRGPQFAGDGKWWVEVILCDGPATRGEKVEMPLSMHVTPPARDYSSMGQKVAEREEGDAAPVVQSPAQSEEGDDIDQEVEQGEEAGTAPVVQSSAQSEEDDNAGQESQDEEAVGEVQEDLERDFAPVRPQTGYRKVKLEG